MTIEEQQQFDELKKSVVSLEKQMLALNNNATIPFDVGVAMKARILQDAGVLATSSKSASSENVSVLTSTGPNVFASVLTPPDGFLAVAITGNVYYIPYYS